MWHGVFNLIDVISSWTEHQLRSILNELSDYLADWSYLIQMILTDDMKCFLSQFTNGKDQRMWVMWKSLTFINLCFVAIVNKDIFFQGEMHWHPLKVFKGHMAMQKVILHLVIYIRQLQKAVYLQYHYRHLPMHSGLHCFIYF